MWRCVIKIDLSLEFQCKVNAQLYICTFYEYMRYMLD